MTIFYNVFVYVVHLLRRSYHEPAVQAGGSGGLPHGTAADQERGQQRQACWPAFVCLLIGGPGIGVNASAPGGREALLGWHAWFRQEASQNIYFLKFTT